ncbi:serine hydrolase [Xanthomonas sp. XNM01]|uniref:serine hydrolase n=1 Tax=Xanthomonas sp. XNM01 TaxID=2769289 RepID=UPI001783FEF1|nr:serine hydrolase [Xanthomonas sp. XNM01]MBD9369784.1 serine hydrolase [Xanthomonas sp. XNM01]
MDHRMRRTMLAAGLVMVMAVPAHAAAPPEPAVDALFAAWSGTGTPGCAVGVARAGDPLLLRGHGMASLEHAVPIMPDTPFHAASVAKQFTAFAIGLLARDGRLRLDDDVRLHLPELPDQGHVITLEQLVHHTAGLREQGVLLSLAGWRGSDLVTWDDILGIVARQRGLNFVPGSELGYGNVGYTLLAQVVERVSGQSLPAFAQARIFAPLDMRHTRIVDDPGHLVHGRASGHRALAEGGWALSQPMFAHTGPSNLSTTVGDLLRWQRNLADGRVGGPALRDWMRNSGRVDGDETGYAGGLILGAHRGLRTFGHDGMDAGYRANVVSFPAQALDVAVLCNASGIDAEALSLQVADLYLDPPLAPRVPAAIASAGPPATAWAGIYWSERSDEVIRLEARNGALRQHGGPAAFVPIGPGTFRPGESTHRWRFRALENGGAELTLWDHWPAPRRFVRIAGTVPDAAALARFAGRYRSDEVGTTFEVALRGSGLELAWPRGQRAVLQPVGGDRFVLPLGTLTFTRAQDGSVDGFSLSNRRLRRLPVPRL